MGIPQSDGGLPATVIRANAIVTNCVRVAEATHMRGGNFVFESPVSRGSESRFAIDGKGEHADMSTHSDLARLAATAGVDRIFFDQCVFGAPTPKATQLIASDELLSHLSPKFSERFCDHPPGTHNSIVGMAADGAAYRTKAAQQK